MFVPEHAPRGAASDLLVGSATALYHVNTRNWERSLLLPFAAGASRCALCAERGAAACDCSERQSAHTNCCVSSSSTRAMTGVLCVPHRCNHAGDGQCTAVSGSLDSASRMALVSDGIGLARAVHFGNGASSDRADPYAAEPMPPLVCGVSAAFEPVLAVWLLSPLCLPASAGTCAPVDLGAAAGCAGGGAPEELEGVQLASELAGGNGRRSTEGGGWRLPAGPELEASQGSGGGGISGRGALGGETDLLGEQEEEEEGSARRSWGDATRSRPWVRSCTGPLKSRVVRTHYKYQCCMCATLTPAILSGR